MSESSKSAYFVCDPGDVSGWAEFAHDGSLLGYGQVDESQFMEFITDRVHSDLELVICEDFTLFQHKAMAQTNARSRKMKTSKKIGQMEMTCQLRNVKMVLQPANIKTIGYKWAGLEPPSNHAISHQFDAVAHGVFYLQKNGIRKPSIRNDDAV